MNSLLKFFTLGLLFFTFFACKEASKGAANDKSGSQVTADSVAIAEVVHSFYKWYEANGEALANTIFVKGGKSTTIDNVKFDEYFALLAKSGYLSQVFIDTERAEFKNLEATNWKTENVDEEPISGLDYDRFLCSQEMEDFDLLTTAPVSIQKVGTDKVTALLMISDDYQAKKFELVKENGKWLIAKFICE